MKAQLELEKELRRWREERARKQGGRPAPHEGRPAPKERRTVRVNGQEVLVITRPKRSPLI